MSPDVIHNLMSHFNVPAKAERGPLDTYADALTQLEKAIDELDQAHATLRDIGCEHYHYQAKRSVRQIHDDAVALLGSIQQLGCDDCGRPVREHKIGQCEEWS